MEAGNEVCNVTVLVATQSTDPTAPVNVIGYVAGKIEVDDVPGAKRVETATNAVGR